MPSSLQARKTRIAISPRLATSTDLIFCIVYPPSDSTVPILLKKVTNCNGFSVSISVYRKT